MLVMALTVLPAPPVRAAQPYPGAPVHILVPFAPGGVADILPRVIGEELAKTWGQPDIIDNKPGAGGNLGMDAGARAAPDGLTLILAPAGNLTVTPLLYRHLRFDVRRDFVPVTELAASPNVLVVNPALDVHSVAELITYARSHPGALNFASPGEGSGAHLAGELLNAEAHVSIEHVPYKGIGPAINDLLGGHVQMMFAGISSVLELVKSGKLRALAVASPKRVPLLPEVPTVAESGLPGFEVTSWYGILVPAGTPAATVVTLQHDIAEALADPTVRTRLGNLGLEPVGSTSAAFNALIQTETVKWDAIVKKANIEPLD